MAHLVAEAVGRLAQQAGADDRKVCSSLHPEASSGFETESRMTRVKSSAGRADWAHVLGLTTMAIFFAGGLGIAAACGAQQPGQRIFDSPAAAVSAFFAAVSSHDTQALLAILGPDASRIVSSGDSTEDADDRANFVSKYDQMHRLAQEPDGTLTLYVGAENWPMPIPIVQSGHAWYFDTVAGEKEILYRRIGRNELSAVRVLGQLVAAQHEYWSMRHEYARHIFSASGQHDGLYWQAAPGEPESPIGPLVAAAAAAAAGHAEAGKSHPTAFRGYYYHVLTRQGVSARGGARSYLIGGRMLRGFAFVAYPAEYRSSGVMTFIVGEDGTVYQKNLGPRTAMIARAMRSYAPDLSWQRSQE